MIKKVIVVILTLVTAPLLILFSVATNTFALYDILWKFLKGEKS